MEELSTETIEIPLVGRKGEITGLAIISAVDFDVVNKFTWYKHPDGYAVTKTYENGWRKTKTLLMHRLILNPKGNNYVDHRNGTRLDNRRENIRECSPTQNHFNQGVRKDSKTGVKGVVWDKEKSKYLAQIRSYGKNTNLGRFENIEDAKRAYDEAARIMQGEFFYGK